MATLCFVLCLSWYSVTKVETSDCINDVIHISVGGGCTRDTEVAIQQAKRG